MKIILNKSFGEIQIETADDKDAVAQASFWSELPDTCPVCGATLYLHFRLTKEGDYKYYELYCRGQVKHFTQFGQYKTGGLFYKPNSWAEHTFGGVQNERDAEIARYEEPPPKPEPKPPVKPQDKPIGERIRHIEAALKKMGVKEPPVMLTGRTDAELEFEFTTLANQWQRLSKTQGK